MHELSFGTWLIHIATVFEWIIAIYLIARYSFKSNIKSYLWLAFAMLPNLISAMAAITWHVYDNTDELSYLVVLQAFMTTFGNCCLAISAWNLNKSKESLS